MQPTSANSSPEIWHPRPSHGSETSDCSAFLALCQRHGAAQGQRPQETRILNMLKDFLGKNHIISKCEVSFRGQTRYDGKKHTLVLDNATNITCTVWCECKSFLPAVARYRLVLQLQSPRQILAEYVGKGSRRHPWQKQQMGAPWKVPQNW